MTRYLSIDLGDKRTGIASADSIVRIATPVAVLEVPIAERDGEALLDAIVSIIDQFWTPRDSGELVVGLPLNMDDTEGPRAKLVREFAARIANRTKRHIHFFDERLSSADADWKMNQSGLTHSQKKARRDAIAAAGILDGFVKQLL